MLTAQGAFKYADKNNPWRFYKNSTGGKKFDYSYRVIPEKYGSKGASKEPLGKPSSIWFLPEGD